MSKTTSKKPGLEDGIEVVKWYTRARRFPQLIGKTPDGAQIWGGPYTYTQVVAGVGFLVIGSKTRPVWGHFGLVGNTLMLLAVTYGLVLLLGRLPIGSRNPLSVGTGLLRALSSPPQGNLAGARVRIPRPSQARSRVVITYDAPTLGDLTAKSGHTSRTGSTAVTRRAVSLPQSLPRSLPRPQRFWSAPAPITRHPEAVPPAPGAALVGPSAPSSGSPAASNTRLRPTPASTSRAAGTPALTGVQRLLASSGSTTQED